MRKFMIGLPVEAVKAFKNATFIIPEKTTKVSNST